MKVLVLGGDGFIGSHFVDQALSLGHEITVFDRFRNQVSINLEHQRGKIRFISGEFANRDDLLKSLEGQEVVYHFICATTPADSWNDPLIEIKENLENSIQLFKLAVSQGVRKIVFPSSGGTVYGSQNEGVDENSTPQPLSPYGITKLATEHFLHYFHSHDNIGVDIYRIGNAYGPRQSVHRPQGVIAVWIRDILQDSEIQVYGDQTTLRDYVYIEDIAYLMTNSLLELESSDVYNIGTGVGTSVIRLLEIFQEVVEKPFRYCVRPRRSLDNTSIVLDSSKLVTRFPGFTYQKLEDKIQESWDYFKTRYSKTLA
jgi:UDP-glucose 4-epimerase